MDPLEIFVGVFAVVWAIGVMLILSYRNPVDWLIERAMRTPYFHLDGYMKRYWLVPYARPVPRVIGTDVFYDGTGPVSWRRPIAKLLQRFGIAARIHCILRSDHGRDPHDHPWWYLTIILRGGYVEERFDADGKLVSFEYHGRGSILFRRANSLHKLYVYGKPVWTLFITGKKTQTWGFKPEGAPKIPYYQYEGEA